MHLAHADTAGDAGRNRKAELRALVTLSQVKCQESSVNKEGIIIYCRMGHTNLHLCVFPSSSYPSFIIALSAEGQGG